VRTALESTAVGLGFESGMVFAKASALGVPPVRVGGINAVAVVLSMNVGPEKVTSWAVAFDVLVQVDAVPEELVAVAGERDLVAMAAF